MKEVKDREQVQAYLQAHQMEAIFPEAIMPHLSLYHVERGEFVCSQSEASHHLYVLVKGKVKIYTTSAEGKTLILSFKTPLEVIGDIEYVQGGDMINTVEAVSSVVLIGVHHRWLQEYASEHAPFLQFLLEIITRKFRIKSDAMSFNLMYPVEVRLASYLLSVSFDETDARFEGQISTASLMDAANLIGTSYRHLNRVLKRFCTEGLIERQKGALQILDKEGLRALVSQNIYE